MTSICVINVARLITAIVLDQNDISYSTFATTILTTLEIEIGIINACLPTINPLFTRARKCAKRDQSADRYPDDSDHMPLQLNQILNFHGGESSATAYTENNGASLPVSDPSKEEIRVTRDMIVHSEHVI